MYIHTNIYKAQLWEISECDLPDDSKAGTVLANELIMMEMLRIEGYQSDSRVELKSRTKFRRSCKIEWPSIFVEA
jgi:hypothetical protein